MSVQSPAQAGLELVDDYGCCALDTADGTGHEGPCGRRCYLCHGAPGKCPWCLGDGPELAGCHGCDTTGDCPEGCDEGWQWDE